MPSPGNSMILTMVAAFLLGAPAIAYFAWRGRFRLYAGLLAVLMAVSLLTFAMPHWYRWSNGEDYTMMAATLFGMCGIIITLTLWALALVASAQGARRRASRQPFQMKKEAQ